MIVNTAVPRARLDAAIQSGCAPHLHSILAAVRDAGVALCIVPQGDEAFDLPDNKPTIVIIGDDMLQSLGPSAFHRPSLDRFVKRCTGAIIVSCEPLPAAYASAAASAAVLGTDVVIVETQPKHGADWKAVLDAINPALAYLLCMVKPDGDVH